MLKLLSICAALAVFSHTAEAQQRAAVVQKVAVPGAEFDIAVVSAKPGSPQVDFRGQPDPLLVPVMGGELVLAYDQQTQTVFPAALSLLSPSCALHVEDKTSTSPTPVAIYFIPKAD